MNQDVQLNIRHLTALASEQESLDASVAKLAKAQADWGKQIVTSNELHLQQEARTSF
jgi:hypothetical protein